MLESGPRPETRHNQENTHKILRDICGPFTWIDNPESAELSTIMRAKQEPFNQLGIGITNMNLYGGEPKFYWWIEANKKLKVINAGYGPFDTFEDAERGLAQYLQEVKKDLDNRE